MANAPASPPPPPTTAKELTEKEAAAMPEQCETLAGEGPAVHLQQPSGTAGSPSPLQIEKKADFVEPPPIPKTPTVEEGPIATKKSCRTTKAQENKEFGAGTAALGAGMIVAWSFLSPGDRGAHNLRYIIPIFLSFSCFVSGTSLMFLSMNILGLPEHIVADVQETTARCLSVLCSILPVVTLLSPFVLGDYKLYMYIGLTLLVIVAAPIVLLRWYIGRKAKQGDEQAAENGHDGHEAENGHNGQTAESDHEAQLEDAFKFISAISNSASGGLVSLLVNYNATGGACCTRGVVLVAVFFIFMTTIWGFLSMEIRAKILEIRSTRLRGFIIQAVSLSIIFMLLSIACAILAEVFAIVGFYVLVALAPWIFASIVYLFRKFGIHHARVPARDNSSDMPWDVILKVKADRGIKITMWSFSAIISIFGGFLHGHAKVESLKACIILFCSAFMSGLALSVLTVKAKPPISTSLAAATTVLDWSAGTMITAAVFAVIAATVVETL